MIQFEPLTIPIIKNLKFQKLKMAAAAILVNEKISVCQWRLQQFRQNLTQWCSATLFTIPAIKNLKLLKSINFVSVYLRNGLTARHNVWHDDAYGPSQPDQQLKFWTRQGNITPKVPLPQKNYKISFYVGFMLGWA